MRTDSVAGRRRRLPFRRAICQDILDFLVRSSANPVAKPPFEACHTVSEPPVFAAVAAATIIRSCLQQLKFDEDTIIGSAIWFDRPAILGTQLGGGFLDLPLTDGSRQPEPQWSHST